MLHVRDDALEILEDQEAIIYDAQNEVFVTWNGSETFQVITPKGEVIALWTSSGSSEYGPCSPAEALANMQQKVKDQMIVDEQYDAELKKWIPYKRHYLAVYATDYETYQRYGGDRVTF